MIRKVKYSDWPINRKFIPKSIDEGYEEYWDKERERCEDGVYLDSVYIPGKLYFHLNYWHVEVDYKDEMGRKRQRYMPPPLRDIEWTVFNEIHRSEIGDEEMGQKGLAIGGCRRISKSYIITSYLAHGITFDEGSENVLVGVNSKDIRITSTKLRKGLQYLPKEWQWKALNKDWDSQVDFGIEEKDGEKRIFSHLMFRNLANGNNSETLAGLKPRKLVIEEAAKARFLNGLQAATPSFTTPYGATCSPLVIFTGGDVLNGKDAKELFFSPEAYNFQAYDDPKVIGRKTGLFLGNSWRMDAKVETTLDKYLGIESKELSKVKIQVSDPEKAAYILKRDLEKKGKSADRDAYYKEKMYYPVDVDDIFLNTFTSIFNTEIAKAQLTRLKTNQIKGTYVELYEDIDGNVKHKVSEKIPVSNFPMKPTDDKEAPIVIYEFPSSDPPYGLYVKGTDPYRQGQAKYSDSLGSTYIFKRMHDLNSNTFQDMFVASYAARPDKHKDWNEQSRLLTKFYNARDLCENDEMSYIDYMISKNEGHYLEDQPAWLKDIQNKTSVEREKGIHRSSSRIRDFLHTCLKNYMEEELAIEKDKDNNVTRKVLGVSRILDPMLLEEIIAYNDSDNFDRVIAAELALALALKLDPIIGRVGKKDDMVKAILNRNTTTKQKLFTAGSLFGRKRSRGIFR